MAELSERYQKRREAGQRRWQVDLRGPLVRRRFGAALDFARCQGPARKETSSLLWSGTETTDLEVIFGDVERSASIVAMKGAGK